MENAVSVPAKLPGKLTASPESLKHKLTCCSKSRTRAARHSAI